MNRIVTPEDLVLHPYTKPGDWIFDTPTRYNSLNYYFVNTELKGLSGTPTFWLDGDKLGSLNDIKFQHSDEIVPWVIKKVQFKSIPGTQVKFRSFICKGTGFELSGEDDTFSGVLHWPAHRKFLTGNFGFHGNQTAKAHIFDISVPDGGSIILRGFEAQGGFTCRFQQKNEAVTVENFIMQNFYIHDTYTGEGIYVGSTVKETVTPKFKNVVIKDFAIARTAAEGLQLQHMAGSDVGFGNLFAVDTSWLCAFEGDQSTGIQFTAAEGINRLHHILVDGYGNPGLNPFSVNSLDYKAEPVNETHFDDIVMYGGRGCGSYLNLSMRNGIKWKFNVTYGGFNGTWYENTGNTVKPMIHSGPITDDVEFIRLIHDGSKFPLFDKPYQVREIIERPVPAPRYRNSGFHEPSYYIMQWSQFYPKYFPAGKAKTPTLWKAGYIAIDTQNYAFYKCLRDHTATAVRPPDNPDFVKLTWDSEAVRSDQPGWNSLLSQSLYPPDDLRPAPGSPYAHLGFQIREEILREWYENGVRRTLTNDGNIY